MLTSRMRSFLKEMLIKLKENPNEEEWKRVIEDSIKCAIKLWGIKKLLDATWNELALSCFWLVMLKRGITKYKLTYLIDTAKDILRKRIRSSRVMRATTLLRRLLNMYDIRKEAVEFARMIIKNLNLDKLSGVSSEYVNKLRTTTVKIINEVAGKVSMSPRMLAACAVYIADKKISKKLGLKPIITAKLLSNITGLSLFSILRKSTIVFDYIKNIDSDAHER